MTGPSSPTALDAVLPVLRCPVCAMDPGPDDDRPLVRDDRRLVCPAGHSFDLARQGYVHLDVGRGRHHGDTAAMVAARDAFLGAGHYDRVTDAVASVLERFGAGAGSGAGAGAGAGLGVIADLAGGTGHHLARVLDRRPGDLGIVLDVSAPALRRAARAHPRAAAVGADVWGRLPLADASLAAAITVFGPRHADETWRVLAPGGLAVTVAPNPDHLAELVGPLGMLGVEADKQSALLAAYAAFESVDVRPVVVTMILRRPDVAALVGMGPSAHHLGGDVLAARIASLPDPVAVTASVTVVTHRRR